MDPRYNRYGDVTAGESGRGFGSGYGGARIQTHARGEVAAPAAARVGAFVQGLLSARGACARASDVARLFRVIEGGNPNTSPLSQPEEAGLSRLVADANAALEPLHLAVKRVTLPAPERQQQRQRQRTTANEDEDENASPERRQEERFDRDAAIADTESRSYYGVVNVEPDDVAQSNGWGLNPAMLAYLRAVLETMVKTSKTACGSTPVSALVSIDHAADAVAADATAASHAVAEATQARRGSADDREGDDEGDAPRTGGSPKSAAAARAERSRAASAAASTTQPPPALKRSERPPALVALAESGWLVRRSPAPSSEACYGIGPRSFMELGELLRSFDPPREVLDAWSMQL